MASTYFVGVDVGTSSVRSGLISATGKLVRMHTKKISVHHPKKDFYEQSSTEIWSAVTDCIRKVTEGLKDGQVSGIGFDATCSLVLVDYQGNGVGVNVDNPSFDVIMWMDHRAGEETRHINASGHSVLRYVGGSISIEMQTPKLLWVKKHLPNVWERTKHFFDLSDFLVWKATGSLKRSLCSTVCKWTYEVGSDGDIKGWSDSFFRQIGLEDLADEGFARLGLDVVSPGTFCGTLNLDSAAAFNLDTKIPVGASLIDAHAGALGMLACAKASQICKPEEILGLICGTSTCHMALSKKGLFVPGVWGPYFSAVLPGYWLLEGGQTAVGSLLDFLLETHPAYEEAGQAAKNRSLPLQQYLESILEEERARVGLSSAALLTADLHLYPDFHGNRAPLADPRMSGMICGLRLERDMLNMAKLYLAAIQAVAYGTRHIVDQMKKFGQTIRVAVICGGLSQSDLFVQTQADVLGVSVIRPEERESVLLGASMLGASATSLDNNALESACVQMAGDGIEFQPNEELKKFHENKYAVFRAMQEDQIKYRSIMQ